MIENFNLYYNLNYKRWKIEKILTNDLVQILN